MRTLLISLFLASPLGGAAQITGYWKTVDDQTQEVKSIVEIVERNGQWFGRVVQIFPQPGDDPAPRCTACEPRDGRYNQPILGMEIIRHMVARGQELTGGTILDPEAGREYRCKIWREGNVLKVRGYWGPVYRTQSWLPHSTIPK